MGDRALGKRPSKEEPREEPDSAPVAKAFISVPPESAHHHAAEQDIIRLARISRAIAPEDQKIELEKQDSPEPEELEAELDLSADLEIVKEKASSLGAKEWLERVYVKGQKVKRRYHKVYRQLERPKRK